MADYTPEFETAFENDVLLQHYSAAESAAYKAFGWRMWQARGKSDLAGERERCAVLAEDQEMDDPDNKQFVSGFYCGVGSAADAIRAMGDA